MSNMLLYRPKFGFETNCIVQSSPTDSVRLAVQVSKEAKLEWD